MSTTDRSPGPRSITSRRFATILAALAVAITAAAIAAPGASAATACVNRTFGQSNTYQVCVRDEQILLNNLWNAGVRWSGGRRLTVDGYYGPLTASDVGFFNGFFDSVLSGDEQTDGFTWWHLCTSNLINGFAGIYWHAVGCPAIT